MVLGLVILLGAGGAKAAGGANARVHRVQRGDTLEALARRYGVPVSGLARANALQDPNRILAGTLLVVSPPAKRSATGSLTPGSPANRLGGPEPALAPRPGTAPGGPRPVRVPPERARLRPHFLRLATSAGVPADLAMAIAWQESGWQAGIVSGTGAVGVMQLMPATVEFASRILLRLPQSLDPTDPVANIRMGTRFLRYLLDRSGGDSGAALAAYYQGLRSVRERGPLPETHRFVANVLALRPRF